MGREGWRMKNRDICDRSFDFALSSIRLYQSLQCVKDGAAWILGKQFVRSATSIGANIEEAQAAESKADFIHKYNIARKEAKESLYWLRLLHKSNLMPEEHLTPVMAEANEITAILTSIIINAKQNRP
jgi:four helix bundle protein